MLLIVKTQSVPSGPTVTSVAVGPLVALQTSHQPKTNNNMAVEKGKIVAVLNTKFKGRSLSKTWKDEFAASVADEIETDDDIDAYVDSQKRFIDLAIKEADRRAASAATTAATKAKQEAAEAITGKGKEEATQEPGEEAKIPEGMPDYMKPFFQGLTQLSQQVANMQKEKVTMDIATRFKGDDRLTALKIPDFIVALATPKSEDEFETAIENLTTQYAPFAKQMHETKFGKDNPGAGGTARVGATGGDPKKATDAELDALMGKMNLTLPTAPKTA